MEKVLAQIVKFSGSLSLCASFAARHDVGSKLISVLSETIVRLRFLDEAKECD